MIEAAILVIELLAGLLIEESGGDFHPDRGHKQVHVVCITWSKSYFISTHSFQHNSYSLRRLSSPATHSSSRGNYVVIVKGQCVPPLSSALMHNT